MLLLWEILIFSYLYKMVDLLPSEADGNMSEEVPSPCENGWSHYGQHCYKVNTGNLSWENAAAECSRTGGKLASIHSEEQNGFLFSLMLNSSVLNTWIGLHRFGWEGSGRIYEEDFAWQDGSVLDYYNCLTSHCSHFNENCVQMGFSSYPTESRVDWKDTLCSTLRPFICQDKMLRIEIKSNEKNDSSDAESFTILIVVLVLVLLMCSLLGGLIYYKRTWIRSKRVELVSALFWKSTPDEEKESGPSAETVEECNEYSAPIYTNVEHLESITFSFSK